MRLMATALRRMATQTLVEKGSMNAKKPEETWDVYSRKINIPYGGEMWPGVTFLN